MPGRQSLRIRSQGGPVQEDGPTSAAIPGHNARLFVRAAWLRSGYQGRRQWQAHAVVLAVQPGGMSWYWPQGL